MANEQMDFYRVSGTSGQIYIAPSQPWTADTVIESLTLTLQKSATSGGSIEVQGGVPNRIRIASLPSGSGYKTIELTASEIEILNTAISSGANTIWAYQSSSRSGDTITLSNPSYYTVAPPPGVYVDALPLDATAEMLMPGVEALSSPHVDHAVVPFTAEASMPMPEIYSVADVAVESVIADATAVMGNARSVREKIVYAPGVWWSTTQGMIKTTNSRVRVGSGDPINSPSIMIEVPWDSAVVPTQEQVERLTLRVGASSPGTTGSTGPMDVYYADEGSPENRTVVNSEFAQQVTVRSFSNDTWFEFDVPVGKKWVVLYSVWSPGGYGVTITNPGETSADNNSHFIAAVSDVPKAEFDAEVADATAEMLHAHAEGQAGVHLWVDAMFAEAEMLNGVFPDANTSANVMDAQALMGAAWFKSDRDLDAEPMFAEATMLNDIDVSVVSNIHVNAAPGVMEEAAIIDPEEVDYTVTDSYWMRVTGRSTEGAVIPRNSQDVWLRFAERRGNEVFDYDTRTGARKADAVEGILMGDYRWGANGPNGKRGLRVINAGLDAYDRVDTYPATLGNTGASYEFTIKVAPGHTGRMDILNGTQRPAVNVGGAVDATAHVSIRDGRIFAETRKGGTSFKRIDDNRWHHIVITPRPNGEWSGQDHFRPLDIYIDGELDRSFMRHENDPRGRTGIPHLVPRPDYYFGQETGNQFVGEITNFVYRHATLSAAHVRELYSDMFGYKPVRVGVATATADILDGKVESNMKRMLALTFTPAGNGPHWSDLSDDGLLNGRLVNANNPVAYTDIMEHGFGEDTDVGNYRLTMQSVHGIQGEDAAWEASGGTPGVGGITQFRDERTGEARFINLQRDVNLDDFDVIYVQDYTNPALNNQRDRLRYEAFFDTLNQALVDGHKLLIFNPYLAADLGWVSATEKVEVLPGLYRGERNDVRSHDIAPFPEMHGVTQQPAPRPVDGSKPELGRRWEYTAWGAAITYNLWGSDVHHNNGYRVVNEVDGLTTLPSWEVEELYYRHQTTNLYPDDTQQRTYGYQLANRSAEHLEWTVSPRNSTDTYEMVHPSESIGLRAGDEFYDFTWTIGAYHWYWHRGSTGSANMTRVGGAELDRLLNTWAIPPGHLRVGTPITTFRSTMHDDFGREVANPYRNHIRNAVIRPGDTLPDGRKVKGYVYMDFATNPAQMMRGGTNIAKQLTLPAGVHNGVQEGSANRAMSRWETPQSVEWDFLRIGRHLTSAPGGTLSISYFKGSQVNPGAKAPYIKVRPMTDTYPIAQTWTPFYEIVGVPHLPWMVRGLAWLLTVDKVTTEFATHSPQAATASGSMTTPMVSTEFDRTVKAPVARATGTIVAPAEAQVREVNVMAFAATASGHMNGLVGGYSAEPAVAFADMPQNVLRPLDIDEVLFFTLTMSNDTITLRMEEN